METNFHQRSVDTVEQVETPALVGDCKASLLKLPPVGAGGGVAEGGGVEGGGDQWRSAGGGALRLKHWLSCCHEGLEMLALLNFLGDLQLGCCSLERWTRETKHGCVLRLLFNCRF